MAANFPEPRRIVVKPVPGVVVERRPLEVENEGDALFDRVLNQMVRLERTKRRRRIQKFILVFLATAALATGIALVFWRQIGDLPKIWPWGN